MNLDDIYAFGDYSLKERLARNKKSIVRFRFEASQNFVEKTKLDDFLGEVFKSW